MHTLEPIIRYRGVVLCPEGLLRFGDGCLEEVNYAKVSITISQTVSDAYQWWKILLQKRMIPYTQL